jgi:hypothetical protein
MPGASAVAVASRYPRDADGSKRHATSRSACLPSASLGYRGTRGCRGSGRPPPTEYPTPFRARGICESRGATCVVPLPRLVSVRARSRTLTHRALTRRTTGLVIYTRAAPSYEPTPTGHPWLRYTQGFGPRKRPKGLTPTRILLERGGLLGPSLRVIRHEARVTPGTGDNRKPRHPRVPWSCAQARSLSSLAGADFAARAATATSGTLATSALTSAASAEVAPASLTLARSTSA